MTSFYCEPHLNILMTLTDAPIQQFMGDASLKEDIAERQLVIDFIVDPTRRNVSSYICQFVHPPHIFKLSRDCILIFQFPLI